MRKNKFRQIESVISFAFFILLSITILSGNLNAQRGNEYRGFWVDTFNTSLNNHNDIVAVVNNVKAANSNAIFAQVRRRGDAWYLNSLEPKPDFTPIAAGFDPLADLIATAHAEGIEVHAFVIMGAVWNKNPTFAPSATLGPPTNPNHVFNLHGGYNSTTKQIVPGPNNWLTRTLLPDNSANGITFQGHRFGAEFWLDFGHPDAEAYSVDVLMQLVRNYDIDGLHLDRIRYPELTVSGQTPTSGANIGYNPTSVERFQRRYNIPVGSPAPVPGDANWAQWRRDQVSNLVRRVYLNSVAVKPQLKVSGALIVYGGGPTTEAGWKSAEAYWRVYQDWRSWTEEGILDIAIPMNYKRETTQAGLFDTWNEWTKNHQYNRASLVGLGAYLNSIEGTLRQTRRSLAPSATGNNIARGIVFYAMANTNEAVTANPLSIPPGQNTPKRSFAEFASGLTTGKSVSGTTFYEDPIANPTPVFSQLATVPVFSWKAAPTKGHLMGFARRDDNTILDTANVTIKNLETNAVRSTATDGGGFYGGVDLTPGQYLVKAQLGSETLYSCVSNVVAGTVTTADLHTETIAPTTSVLLDPPAPNGANGWYTSNVTVNLSAADDCSGVASTEYSIDGGASWVPFTSGFLVSNEGITNIQYRSTDRAGNVETIKNITIQIDKTAPTITLTANPSTIRSPNGKPVTVQLRGTGSDAVSGLASVSYTVTDEYGTSLSIPTRTLSGKSANWTDSI
nr:family 10 glycosylhydrolase [Acidobacteriota bacterium]